MIKQLVPPNTFKQDLINSKLPAVFLDPTAKVKIYLYKTNQNFNEIFFHENEEGVRYIDYFFIKSMWIWHAQNFAKQINPYQSSSAAKTIAFQQEIEFYTTENLKNDLTEAFYFFTFNPINSTNVKTEPKFMVKEIVDNFDRRNFRFSQIKAWQLSSLLFKNYQFWKFESAPNTPTTPTRKKTRSIEIKVPYYAMLGNIIINGNNTIGDVPQNVDYDVRSIEHPFRKLEPLCVTFNYSSNKLSAQLLHWDFFGRMQKKVQNTSWSIGDLNQWWTMEQNLDTYGSVAYQTGAVLKPGGWGTTGTQKGLAQFYDVLKEKSNDIKQYIWPSDYHIGADDAVVLHWYNVSKNQDTGSLRDWNVCLKNSTATLPYRPLWYYKRDPEVMGELFYTYSLTMLNEDNFNTQSQPVDLEEANNKYVWVLAGSVHFRPGVLKDGTNGGQSLTNPDHYTFGIPPWNFQNEDWLRTFFRHFKTANYQYITITLDLKQPTYLNNIAINVVYSEKINLKLTYADGTSRTMETETAFYSIAQNKPTTRITFY